MNPLVTEQLRSDPRVAEAREMLLAALADAQKKLTGIKGADGEREVSYADALKEFAELRGGGLYYPYLGSGIGRGALVELADGSVKYDMIGGIGVHHLGHSNPALVAAAIDAAIGDTVMEGNLQQNVECVALARRLTALACAKGAKLKHCFFTTSGAMANENAMKLMFHKKHPANRILAFEGAFAGRTLVLSQITDKPGFRAGLPNVVAVDYVPFFDGSNNALAVLKRHLARYPRQHALMCMELVQGEGGFNVGDAAFFRAIIDELKSNGVAVWIDEVQTFGRTHQPFAFQMFGLDEQVDVVTIGKMTQVCATLFTDEFRPPPGLVSQTFTGSTSALFSARAVLDELTRGSYFGPDGKNAQVNRWFVSRLQAIGQRHPGWISGPFGIGGMVAFTPFDGEAKRTKAFLQALFKAGVIAFEAGGHPARVRFLPPVPVVTEADVETVCGIVEKTLVEVAGTERS